MAEHADDARVGVEDSADVVTLTREEYDALRAAADGTAPGTPNPEPAYEEGPHLKDKELRALKRRAMRDHGWTAETDGLTDDMRAILAEEE